MTTAVASKQILVRTVGQETPREFQVDLEPGTLVSDVLEQAGLLDWRLSNPKGGSFDTGDRIYDAVDCRQKVLAIKVDDFSAGW